MSALKLHWIYVIHCWGFLIIPCQILTGPNMCGNITQMICCKDYYQQGNRCVQCEPGYFGMNCSIPCPMNYYGRLCQQRCDCSPDKYCDRGRGCLCKQTSVNCTDEDHSDNSVDETFVTKCIECYH